MNDGNNFAGGADATFGELAEQDVYRRMLPESAVQFMMYEAAVNWCYKNMWHNWREIETVVIGKWGWTRDQAEVYFLEFLKRAEKDSFYRLLQEQNNGKTIKDSQCHPAYR